MKQLGHPDGLTVDWHLERLNALVQYLEKDRGTWVIDAILRRVDALGFSPLQRAAIYGLVQAFAGNSEARRAKEKQREKDL